MLTKVTKAHEYSVHFPINFFPKTRKDYGERVDSFRSYVSVVLGSPGESGAPMGLIFQDHREGDITSLPKILRCYVNGFSLL